MCGRGGGHNRNEHFRIKFTLKHMALKWPETVPPTRRRRQHNVTKNNQSMNSWTRFEVNAISILCRGGLKLIRMEGNSWGFSRAWWKLILMVMQSEYSAELGQYNICWCPGSLHHQVISMPWYWLFYDKCTLEKGSHTPIPSLCWEMIENTEN